MRRVGLTIALAAIASLSALLASGARRREAATSTIPFTTCADAPAFGCAHLTVPLDPTGAIPGHRHALDPPQARRDRHRDRGRDRARRRSRPGGAAVRRTTRRRSWQRRCDARPRRLRPARHRRLRRAQVLGAQQRDRAAQHASIPDCAMQIGADPRALHDRRLGLRHRADPQGARLHASSSSTAPPTGRRSRCATPPSTPTTSPALVLDSTVTPNGPDVFDQSSYRRCRGSSASCAPRGACPGIANPLGDLEKVLARLGRRAVDGRPTTTARASATSVMIDPGDDRAGAAQPATTTRSLRADFPAAIAAAAAGHYGLLAILVDHAVRRRSRDQHAIDNPLFFDTECEELPFPWNRADTPRRARSEALAAAAGDARGDVRPVQRATAFAAELGRRLRLLAVRDRRARADDHRAARTCRR